MALGDYILCCKCEVKLIYDGDRGQREWWEERFGKPPEIECPDCKAPASKPLTDSQIEADMFWNYDDAETPHDSVEEFLNNEICNGCLEVGAVFTLLRAKRLPNIKIKVTNIDENESEAEYEIIEAAHGIKEQS